MRTHDSVSILDSIIRHSIYDGVSILDSNIKHSIYENP